MNSRNIVVVGSSNTDVVVKTERLPVPGETVLGNSFMMNPGGKGANQAVAASRLGGNVTFITKTGNDLFGRQSIELFTEENINTNFIFSDSNHPSGVALIMVDSLGENCIVVASGANMSLSSSDIKKASNAFEQAGILLMQLEIPMQTVEYTAKMAFDKGIKVILNPAPAAYLKEDLYKCLYAIVPNKTEAEILSGIKVSDIDSAKRAADIIASKGVNIVVVTLGSKGALIKEGNEYNYIEAERVEAVDTTAAGDTFCGALSVALSEGLSIVEAVKLANKASAITVTREGAQNSIPYRNEIQF